MILHRVIATEPKLKLQRLHIRYPEHKEPGTVTVSTSTVKNHNKYCVVHPQTFIVELWDCAVSSTLTVNQRNLIGKWIHGADHQHPWR